MITLANHFHPAEHIGFNDRPTVRSLDASWWYGFRLFDEAYAANPYVQIRDQVLTLYQQFAVIDGLKISWHDCLYQPVQPLKLL